MDEGRVILVCICNFFRVHAAGKEEDEGGDTDEKKTAGKVWVQCDLGFGCVDLGEQPAQKGSVWDDEDRGAWR